MTLTRVVGVAIALLATVTGAGAQNLSVSPAFSLGITSSYRGGTSFADFGGGDRRGTDKLEVRYAEPAYGGTVRSASGGRGSVYDGYSGGMIEIFSGIPLRTDKADAPALFNDFFAGNTRMWEAISEDYKKSLKRAKRAKKRRTKKPQKSPKSDLGGKKSDRSSLSILPLPAGFQLIMDKIKADGKHIYVPVSNGLKFGRSCECKCKCDPECDAYDPAGCVLCPIYFYHDISYKWIPVATLIGGLTRN